MNSETAVHAERSPQAVIANITEQRYMAQRMYGTFQIAGRGEGESFALTRITPRTAVMDYGDKRTLPLAITAREIAEDLCREINSDAGERSFLGVFVCAGDSPTEAGVARRSGKARRLLPRPGGRGGSRVGTLALVSVHSRFAAARRGAAGPGKGMALPGARNRGVSRLRRARQARRGGLQILPRDSQPRQGAGPRTRPASARGNATETQSRGEEQRLGMEPRMHTDEHG